MSAHKNHLTLFQAAHIKPFFINAIKKPPFWGFVLVFRGFGVYSKNDARKDITIKKPIKKINRLMPLTIWFRLYPKDFGLF